MTARIHEGERIMTSMENEDLIAIIKQSLSRDSLQGMQQFAIQFASIMSEMASMRLENGSDVIITNNITLQGTGDLESDANYVADTLDDRMDAWANRKGYNNGR